MNYKNALFSINKNDITNYNFLVEVITGFNELKYFIDIKELAASLKINIIIINYKINIIKFI